MNYDQRISLILGELIKMMEGYAEPKHLNTQKKKEDEVRNIVRMINQKFPSDATEDQIRGTMDRALLKLKETHTSRTWPTAADISKAISKSMLREVKGIVKSGPFIPDVAKINAKRIRAGEPVARNYIANQSNVQAMLDTGLITSEDLEPYKNYLIFHRID
jgi:hypothetical protein